jgi:Fur family transcriptional regulator, ferric uptake regulator
MSPYIQLFRRYLREQGLPITPQRELVASAIFSMEGHKSVGEIEKLVEDYPGGDGKKVGKATIYRTVDILVKSGLVKKHDFGKDNTARYEHLFGQTPVHEHLVCLGCDRIVEFESPEVIRVQERVAALNGFVPVRHRLEVFGYCSTCQAHGRHESSTGGLTCPVELLD